MNPSELRLYEAITDYGSILGYGLPHEEGIFRKYEKLAYEPRITRLVGVLDYDVFIDVGAAFGYFSMIAAQRAIQVLAIEAQPLRFGFLRWNLRRLAHVSTLNAFIGEKGKPTLEADEPWAMVAKVSSALEGDSDKARPLFGDIPTVGLDRLVADRIGPVGARRMLIKIDVEGNEASVLRSAPKLLASDNCLWIVEVHKESEVDAEVEACLAAYERSVIFDGEICQRVLYERPAT